MPRTKKDDKVSTKKTGDDKSVKPTVASKQKKIKDNNASSIKDTNVVQSAPTLTQEDKKMDDQIQNQASSDPAQQTSQASQSSSTQSDAQNQASSQLPTWLKPNVQTPVQPVQSVSSQAQAQTEPQSQPKPQIQSQPQPQQTVPVPPIETKVQPANQPEVVQQPAANMGALPNWLKPNFQPIQNQTPANVQPQVPPQPQAQAPVNLQQPLQPQVQPAVPVSQATVPPQVPIQPQAVPLQVPQNPIPISQNPVVQAQQPIVNQPQPIPAQPVQPQQPNVFPQQGQMPQMPGMKPQGLPMQQPGQAVQPQKPYKPMTLSDLAQQTPIFGAEDLDFSKERRRKLREQKRQEELKKQQESGQRLAVSGQSEEVRGQKLEVSDKKEEKPKPITEEPKIKQESQPIPEIKSQPIVEAPKFTETPKQEEEKPEIKEAEVINAEVVDSKESKPEIEDKEPSLIDELKENIKKALKDANITGRHILGCFGGVLAVIIFIYLIVIAIKWIFSTGIDEINNYQPEDETEVEEEVQEEEEEEEDPEPVDTGSDIQVRVDGSLYTGIIISGFIPNIDNQGNIIEVEIESSLNAGIIAGGVIDETSQSLMVDAIEHLEYMKQLYNVNVRDLITISNNKTADLNRHIKAYEDAISKAQTTYTQIQETKAEIKQNYDAMTGQKDTYEGQFFGSFSNFEGYMAEQYLSSFIDVKKKQVEYKAQYNAWSSLEKYYEKYIPVLKTRLKDIQYNQDALINGIQVYILENSEGLDLVIDVPEGGL